METSQKDTLVITDQSGGYFVLAQETLERGRIPAEHAAELEHLIAEAGGEDVQGHSYRILLSPTLVRLLDDLSRAVAPLAAPIPAWPEGTTTYYPN